MDDTDRFLDLTKGETLPASESSSGRDKEAADGRFVSWTADFIRYEISSILVA